MGRGVHVGRLRRTHSYCSAAFQAACEIVDPASDVLRTQASLLAFKLIEHTVLKPPGVSPIGRVRRGS